LRLLWNTLKTVSTISTILSDQPWFTVCVEEWDWPENIKLST
jgi:hypothetical protein